MTSQSHHEDLKARFEPQDFDPWLRLQTASAGNVVNYRTDLTGRISDLVIEQLEMYVPTFLDFELSRHVPQTFVFKGPLGRS